MTIQSQIPVKGHYHCIECGSLFESSIESIQDQRCPVCGNPPTGKILAGTEMDRVVAPVVKSSEAQSHSDRSGVNQETKAIYEATLEAQKKQRHGRVKRTKRKEKTNKKIWVMMGSWLASMAVIVLLVNYFSPKEGEAAIAIEVDSERQRIMFEAEEKKKRVLIQAAVRPCEKAMTSFLNAPSAAEKAQYVYQGVKLSGVMTRYYRNNPSFSSTRSEIRILRGEWLNVPGEKVIGTLCLNSLGERFEAIFIYEDKEWKIDWRSLIRYDARPWSLFPSESDGDEGEYRLYMRVRDADEDLQSKEMIVVFYKPGMYSKTEYRGLASKNVRVVIDSDLGKHIQSMIQSEETLEKDAYGLSIGTTDPPSYHRVRVRMRLHKEEGKEAKMELAEILANHWYGIDVETTQEDAGQEASDEETPDDVGLKSGN